jgi:hypothetical protein
MEDSALPGPGILDRLAPRTRSAAAGQNPRPLGRGGFTCYLYVE